MRAQTSSDDRVAFVTAFYAELTAAGGNLTAVRQAGAFAAFADDFEFHEPPEQPGAGVHRGIDAVIDAFDRWSEAWEHQAVAAEWTQALPGNRLLVLTRTRLRNARGMELEQEGADIWTFAGDQATKVQSFWDRANAAAAAGVADR